MSETDWQFDRSVERVWIYDEIVEGDVPIPIERPTDASPSWLAWITTAEYGETLFLGVRRESVPGLRRDLMVDFPDLRSVVWRAFVTHEDTEDDETVSVVRVDAYRGAAATMRERLFNSGDVLIGVGQITWYEFNRNGPRR